jgi:hypothetical protein
VFSGEWVTDRVDWDNATPQDVRDVIESAGDGKRREGSSGV